MKESLEIIAVNEKDEEVTLLFQLDGDVIDIWYEGEKLCGLDYSNNFVFFLQKALRNWGFAKNDIDEE